MTQLGGLIGQQRTYMNYGICQVNRKDEIGHGRMLTLSISDQGDHDIELQNKKRLYT